MPPSLSGEVGPGWGDALCEAGRLPDHDVRISGDRWEDVARGAEGRWARSSGSARGEKTLGQRAVHGQSMRPRSQAEHAPADAPIALQEVERLHIARIPLPGLFFLILAGMAVAYLAMVQIVKTWFYRRFAAE